jgi:thiamine biosynthesis lipoprotein
MERFISQDYGTQNMKFAAILLAIILITGCTTTVYKVEQSANLLGTKVTITVIHPDRKIAQDALSDALLAIQKVDNLMSIYDNTTQISYLNRKKALKKPAADLLNVINKSIYYSEISDGAFDITVQPVLDLYTRTFRQEKRYPNDSEINEAQKMIGYRKISIENKTVSIGQNTTLTLGGIAKGFALDKAAETLRKDGIDRALIVAGGQIAGLGLKEQQKPWTIALRNPRNANEYITLIEVHNQSVSTSGDYERFYDENKTYHHIINPKTGRSATELISVTVMAKHAIDADALSTAVFALGKDAGMKLIEDTPETEAIIITRDKQIIRSSGFKY